MRGVPAGRSDARAGHCREGEDQRLGCCGAGGSLADLQSALRSLEQFEVLMHEIYNGLCEAFSEDAEASSLFSKLAFEESSHLREVQFLRRLTRQNAAHFAEVELDLDALQREVTQLENVRRAAPQLSLHEAVVIAIEFEGGVAEVHSREAIAKANPDVCAPPGQPPRGRSPASRRPGGFCAEAWDEIGMNSRAASGCAGRAVGGPRWRQRA